MSLQKSLVAVLILPTLIAFNSCNRGQATNTNESSVYVSPPGYDLNHPFVINLHSELDEISGIVYYPKDTSVFAICDNDGFIYKIHLKPNFGVKKWKFSSSRDFEDLALVDGIFYVLASDGTIISCKFNGAKPVSIDTSQIDLNGNNEFESLYKNNDSVNLVTVCKDCEGDTKNAVSAYPFNLATKAFADTPVFKIDAKSIAEKLGKKSIKFKPSAACINPQTHELFIISSENQALVVAAADGKIKRVYSLNPRFYKQPEGIAFTPAGDMIISNESADVGPANLLIFKYKNLLK